MHAPRGMDDRGKVGASGAMSEGLQLGQRGQLVLPVPGRRTTQVQKRALLALPRDAERPKLYVIVTPPEVRERWLRWVAIRQSALLTFFITFALIAAMSVI